MIGSFKTEKIVLENTFEHKKKKPGLRANRPSNNWAPKFRALDSFTEMECNTDVTCSMIKTALKQSVRTNFKWMHYISQPVTGEERNP